jgi:hypothetical protein
MKRILCSPITALALGLGLRLFFVLQFPGGSGDTVIYEQIAENWLKHHVYAMTLPGGLLPVDLRMPGYPAFLAVIYALSGRTAEGARIFVMLAQIFVDLLTCVVVAMLAAVISFRASQGAARKTFTTALWLAALCPFTANYAAVPLTEVFAIFFTSIAVLFFSLQLLYKDGAHWYVGGFSFHAGNSLVSGTFAGLCVGLGTLFRPETPLLLATAIVVLGIAFIRKEKFSRVVLIILLMCGAAVLPLIPWAIRNEITFHKIEFLAPKDATLPGELDPVGFMAWEKTWLYRFRDCYLVPWKLNDEAIDFNDIPPNAFDSAEEKQRVSDILDQYNDQVTLTKDEDQAFAQLARERTARHPLRTYLWLPMRRMVRIWFTPRIELLPVSGNVFPIAQMADEDPADQRVTSGLFLLNILYVGLGIAGGVSLYRNRAARPALALMLLYITLRTLFLSTLETPEPRYVLVCFPLLIALGAQLFARNDKNPLAPAP